MRGQGAARTPPDPSLREATLKSTRPAGAAAAARGEAHVILDGEIDGRRSGDDIDPARRRHSAATPEFDRLEIDHQRVRHDVVGAIRPAVECAGILRRQGERRVVDDDVAVNRLQARGAQRAARSSTSAPASCRDRRRPAGSRSPSSTPALDLAANRGSRVPGERRSQQVQGRERGDHLDGRCGTARRIGVLTRAPGGPESRSTMAKLTALGGKPCAADDLRHAAPGSSRGGANAAASTRTAARCRCNARATRCQTHDRFSRRAAAQCAATRRTTSEETASTQGSRYRSMPRTIRRPRPIRIAAASPPSRRPAANDRLCASGTNSSHDNASTMTAGSRTSPAPRRQALLLILSPSNN